MFGLDTQPLLIWIWYVVLALAAVVVFAYAKSAGEAARHLRAHRW